MTGTDDRTRGLELLRETMQVSRETEARLDRYADLLVRWQRAKNLVGPATLSELWTRHIADSAQALAALPRARRWVDLGSGAGLPGLIIAILLAEHEDASVALVEANARKCAFLRTAVRETGAPATVHAGRIESMLANWRTPCDAVSARALAPMSELLDLASPLLHQGAVGVFHKGQDIEIELTAASTCWNIKADIVHSRTHPDGVLVMVRDCAARSA